MVSAALNRSMVFSRARQFKKADFDKFDLVIVMDDSNFKNVYSITPTELHKSKIKKFTDFSTSSDGIVPDPYLAEMKGLRKS